MMRHERCCDNKVNQPTKRIQGNKPHDTIHPIHWKQLHVGHSDQQTRHSTRSYSTDMSPQQTWQWLCLAIKGVIANNYLVSVWYLVFNESKLQKSQVIHRNLKQENKVGQEICNPSKINAIKPQTNDIIRVQKCKWCNTLHVTFHWM